MSYKCSHCSRFFSTPYALKRHISEKHQYNNIDEIGEAVTQTNIAEELRLWDEPYEEEPGLWDEDDFTMNYSKVISKPSFYSNNK
jgi:hypothetical protein